MIDTAARKPLTGSSRLFVLSYLTLNGSPTKAYGRVTPSWVMTSCSARIPPWIDQLVPSFRVIPIFSIRAR